MDVLKRVRETYGDEMAERMKVFTESMDKAFPCAPFGKTLDLRPIFIIAATTAFLWGKDPRGVITAEVYGKVMDLMNMFFEDKTEE